MNADDWWDDLFDPARPDTGSAAPVRPPAGGARLPDWRTGQTIDLAQPEETAAPWADVPDEQPLPVRRPAAPAVDPDPEDDEDEAAEDQDDEDEPEQGAVERPARTPARERVAQAREHLALDHRTVVLLYNGSAAGVGYLARLVPTIHNWIAECGRDTSVVPALLVGIGVIAAIGQQWDRHTRGWYAPLAWAARIPLASAVLALGLYSPAAALGADVHAPVIL
ncbi:hypothetical protein [Streptomyces sp. Z26]|uniref:hypothetical protein n=1 Tax=Streptomyces sp. Z26 TaxID=2500177 RepID=UPI000EF148B1|nr:hypothetical protein [Streptomyces sp. Z26]RLL68151.1 hypothetical protein D7M15_16350 [Streptomyces sp. Z26]